MSLKNHTNLFIRIEISAGQICQFYGWGMSKLPDPKDKNIEYSLRKSQMEIVKNEKCAAYGINLTENQFCAGKSLSPCQVKAEQYQRQNRLTFLGRRRRSFDVSNG